MSGKKAFLQNTFQGGDQLKSPAFSVTDFKGTSRTLAQVKLDSKNFTALIVKCKLVFREPTSKKMKEGRNTQTCMFVKAPGVRLKKSSKYDVQVNFSRPLPICKFHGPSEKSRYRSYRPNGNTACWKPRLLGLWIVNRGFFVRIFGQRCLLMSQHFASSPSSVPSARLLGGYS